MGLSHGITVRLEPALRQRLSVVAEKSGLKAADLARMAILSYCDEIERTGRVQIIVGTPGVAQLHAGTGDNIFPIGVVPAGRARLRASKKKKG